MRRICCDKGNGFAHIDMADNDTGGRSRRILEKSRGRLDGEMRMGSMNDCPDAEEADHAILLSLTA